MELIRSSFTHFEALNDYQPPAPVMHQVGRGVLGVNAWRLLGLVHTDPMTAPLRAAWAKFFRRDPKRAVEAWAAIRGESVDASSVLETLKDARVLGAPDAELN